MMYRFLGRKKILWLIISVVLIIPGVITLITQGLPLGIDFRGGSVLEVGFTENISKSDLVAKVASYPEARGAQVISSEENIFIIKTLTLSDGERRLIVDNLRRDLGELTERRYEVVGPAVSADLTRNAIIAVVLASVLILLYLAYSFRSVSYPVSSWRFGLTSLAALVHDVIITVGAFAILAYFFDFELDVSFITALLTVMGFSVHDTIVVFDRIRENLGQRKINTAQEFEQIADSSLSETLNRSIGTSLTVMITLTALAVLGGDTIRPFVLTLLIGVAIGTYSSIFTATPLLVVWQNFIFKKLNKNLQ